MSQFKGRARQEEFLLLGLFVLLRPSTDEILAHQGQQYAFPIQTFASSTNTLRYTQRNIPLNIWIYHDPIKLTSKINHRRQTLDLELMLEFC